LPRKRPGFPEERRKGKKKLTFSRGGATLLHNPKTPCRRTRLFRQVKSKNYRRWGGGDGKNRLLHKIIIFGGVKKNSIKRGEEKKRRGFGKDELGGRGM